MTLSDIAKLAGVSKATASRAFTTPSPISEQARQRVLAIAKQYNYRPNSLAQAIATHSSGLLGFCVYRKSMPFFGHAFYGPILDGVTEQAKQMGYHIVLGISEDNSDYDAQNRFDTFEERFIEDGIDGAILATFIPHDTLRAFHARGTPVVLINEEVSEEHTGFVVDDNYGGIQKMMHHLIDERGYESIAFISQRLSHTSSLIRYISFVDALVEHGLQAYHSLNKTNTNYLGKYQFFNESVLSKHGYMEIPTYGNPYVIAPGHIYFPPSTFDTLLNQEKLPRAIVCATDNIAVSLIRSLHARGIRVPEDVAVSGYDDIESACYLEPSLTTISVNRHEMGKAAVRLLQKYIDDADAPSETVCVGNKLIVREST